MRRPGDAAFLDRAMQGDAQAFGNLYERFLEDIYGYIYYRVGRTQTAETLTEQVFLKAWEALPAFRQANISFPLWLYKIACSLIADHDHRRREPPSFAQLNPFGSGHTSPDEALSSQEPVERLQRAMALLPALDQDLLILRFVNELSLAEVASVLERRPDEVRVLQHRALKALDALLEDSSRSGHFEDDD